MQAFLDEKPREQETMEKGMGLNDCGIKTRWRNDGALFRQVRYAEEPSSDSWNGPDASPTQRHTRRNQQE
ncbi:DUF1176 domain-containing protein, partial [Salmonella enterica]|uniref:DUF1176 domain-containing protein n=1 Tax=Salmonella enterica TaxID=28901 RepID=UPI003C6DCB9F